MPMKKLAVLVVLVCATLARGADSLVDQALSLRVPAIFSDNMVLQRGIGVPVWGWAIPGKEVTVAFAGQKKMATADDKGRWMVQLDALVAGGPHSMVIHAGQNIVLKNILVGEVWVCSGQSNMEWPLRLTLNGEEAATNAPNPKIRLFTVKRAMSETPADDVKGEWKLCERNSVLDFSAVAYYFGRELEKTLGVPIGLIHTSWGGTPIEAWTRKEVMANDPQLKGIIEGYAKRLEAYRKEDAAYQEALKTHKEAVEEAKKAEKPAPEAPKPPRHPGMAPSVLYNGMIAPIVQYGIAGAIWYQGESNAGNALGYRHHMPTMISNWRDDWKQGEFPFFIVQLANYMKREDQPTDPDWAWLREAQLMTLSKSPKTGMAVAIDIGEADDIHPRNKEDVGERLALNALAIAYGKDVAYSGPIYDSMKMEGDKVRLSFKHAGGGLMSKGGEALKGFAIAGADQKFVWAEAKIESNDVVVWSKAVPNPVAVRYGWANNPEVNLYNKEGLPASPFRTDDWPRKK